MWRGDADRSGRRVLHSAHRQNACLDSAAAAPALSLRAAAILRYRPAGTIAPVSPRTLRPSGL